MRHGLVGIGATSRFLGIRPILRPNYFIGSRMIGTPSRICGRVYRSRILVGFITLRGMGGFIIPRCRNFFRSAVFLGVRSRMSVRFCSIGRGGTVFGSTGLYRTSSSCCLSIRAGIGIRNGSGILLSNRSRVGNIRA